MSDFDLQMKKKFTGRGFIAALDQSGGSTPKAILFGTKMRSFISRAQPHGIHEVVKQQFEYVGRILAAGLVPIIVPEVDIHAPDKSEAGLPPGGFLL